MIRSFKHRGLKRLYERGDRSGIRADLLDTVERILTVLDSATTLARFPVWLAHHTNAAAPQIAAPWSSWTFWQYSGNGQAAGVTLPVDLDRFNGSLDDLRKLTVSSA